MKRLLTLVVAALVLAFAAPLTSALAADNDTAGTNAVDNAMKGDNGDVKADQQTKTTKHKHKHKHKHKGTKSSADEKGDNKDATGDDKGSDKGGEGESK